MGLHNLLPIATLVFCIFFAHILVEKAEVYGIFFLLDRYAPPPNAGRRVSDTLTADDGC
jgi:hypothetical protein